MDMKKLVFLSLLLLTACGRFSNNDEKQANAKRIVCIAKQYNEIIFALGAERDLVAVDLSSTYLPEKTHVKKVGYECTNRY
jgi:iron complex transport system substrate-binding protein